jgi:hypothetical protein
MTKKITVHLRGGLGNQLFTYAAGLVISGNSKLKLKLNTRGVDHFETIQPIILSGTRINRGLSTKLIRLHESKFMKSSHQDLSNPIGFSDISLALSDKLNHNLRGYFQTYKFAEELLRRNINISIPDPPLNSWIRHKIDEMRASNSTLIHLRLGDYEKARGTIGLLSLEYFEETISNNNLQGNQIYVISDDPNGALTFFSESKFLNVNVLNPPEPTSALDQLHLFKGAESIITSNSSFSWWGSWFARDSAKVFVPFPWFRSVELQEQINEELIYPGWIAQRSIWR